MNAPPPLGRLAIVLHTHMPDVLGRGVWPFGEQWLWEVLGESYLRVADAVRGNPVTIGVTPVLTKQLIELRGEAGDRYTRWVAESREYCFGEDMRSFYEVGRGELSDALAPQLEDHRSGAARYASEFARDFSAIFAGLQAEGAELLAGPATHPVMPLLASDYGRDLQLARGMSAHIERYGDSRGIWLPECAWTPGLDAALARAGVEYFCVDQSEVWGRLDARNLEPVATPAGPIALPIDWQMVELVWGEGGYPAHDSYRSSFARTIHALLPYNNAGGDWNAASARAQAEADADRFLRALAARLEFFSGERDAPGTCVFAADTELFGHWWYEGPWWLAAVLGRAADYGIELVTLEEAVDQAAPVDRPLARASWGADKDLSTWDSRKVAGLVWDQRRAELDLEAAAGGDAPALQAAPELLAAAEDELLALQASDWAFMESRGLTGEYGAERAAGHLAALRGLLGQLSG